uniref:Uncharacterized protein n=1 Tax=Triticum urartu TaxID=4572 RepID=A0A8R7P064_TRIUA
PPLPSPAPSSPPARSPSTASRTEVRASPIIVPLPFRCTSRSRRQGRTPSVSKSSSREGAICGEDRLSVQAETNQDKDKYNTPKYRFVVRFVSLKDSSSVHHSLCTSQLSIYVAYVAYYYHRVMLYLLTLVL